MRPGERVGPYVVRRPLGRGAMGVVLHVVHEETGAEFAMKLVASEVVGDADARARFEREMQSMAKVDDHPGIVRIYSAGATPDGRPYYLMDLVQGRSLKQALGEGLGLEPALDLLAQVGRALAHAHERGLIHRDVKPENVLVSDDGVARLTDFGLARVARTADRLTRTGDLVGTPTHMAPEQAVPTLGDPGPWTDVYSLGVVLYEVLTDGRTPYTGSTVVEVYTKLFEGQPFPRPSAVAPDVDPALEEVCLKALARNPADRHPTARAFVEELERARSSASRAQTRWRRVVLVLALVAACALGLALVAAPYARARREEAARAEAAAKLEGQVAEVEALVARQAFAEAVQVGAPLRASLVTTVASPPEAARLDAALRAARRALLAQACREGRLEDARALVGDLPPAADDPPELALDAALALALTGDAAGALARAGALPAPARARLAAWAGDRSACEAALALIEPPERGRALRWELRASLPDLAPPDVDAVAGEAARPPATSANAERSGWAAVARGEAALAQGQVALAVLNLGELTSPEPELEVALAVGLTRALLARGDARGAAAAAERALRAGGPPLERARALSWAAWASAACAPDAAERGSLDAVAAPVVGPARRGVLGAVKALGPAAPGAAAAAATLEGRAPAEAAFARHFPGGAAARAAGVQAERDLGARGGDGPAGLLLARAFDLATLADQARDPELGRRAAELAAAARRLRPGSAAACVAAARAARARGADARLADAKLADAKLAEGGPGPAAVAAARQAAAAATQAARDAAALRPDDRLARLEVARGLAAGASADGLALDLARLAGEAEARAEGELAGRLGEVVQAFAAARRGAPAQGDDVDDEARVGQGRALVERARRRVAASSDEEGGDPVVRGQVARDLGQALDEALAPLLARVDVAAVATARAALVRALEADAAALDGAASSGVGEAELRLAAVAGPRPARPVLEALLLRATGEGGRPALDAYLALAGDLPARAVIASRAAELSPDLLQRAQRLDPGVPALAIDRALDAAAVSPEAFEGLARSLGDDPQWTLAALDAVSQATRSEGGAALAQALALDGAAADERPARLTARALLWRSRPPFVEEGRRKAEEAEHDRGSRQATALLTRALAGDPSNGAAWLLRALCASSVGRGAGHDRDPDPLVLADVQDDLRAARAAAPWSSATLLAALRVGALDQVPALADELLAAGHFGPGHAERLLAVSSARRVKVEPLVRNFVGATFTLGDAGQTYRQAQRFDGTALQRLALTMRLQAAADHEESRDPYEGEDGVPPLLAALGPDAAAVAATASAAWSAHRARRRDPAWATEARVAATLALAALPPGLAPADLLVVAWRPGAGAGSPELPGLTPLWRAWSGLRRPSTALEVLARQRPRSSRGPLFEDVLEQDGRTWALLVGAQAGRGWQGSWLVDRHAFAEAALAFDRGCALRTDSSLEESWYWQLLWGLRWEAGEKKDPADALALRRHALAACRRAAAALQSPTLRALEADLLLDAALLVAPVAERAALAARARKQAEAVALDDISENLESAATAAWRLVRHRAAAGDGAGVREAVKLLEEAVEEDDDWSLREYVRREPLRALLEEAPEVKALFEKYERR